MLNETCLQITAYLTEEEHQHSKSKKAKYFDISRSLTLSWTVMATLGLSASIIFTNPSTQSTTFTILQMAVIDRSEDENVA